jgi:3-dehydroquinate dehydratase
MMNERKEGASSESLTPIQKIEENVAKLAESKGLKLVVAQSNVEGTIYASTLYQ